MSAADRLNEIEARANRATEAEPGVLASEEALLIVAALRAALELHRPEPYAQGPDYCAECEHRYPCETVRAIEEALA